MGKTKSEEPSGVAEPSEPIARADAVARLKTDFDRFYFVTGQMDLDLYEEDCTFADPFVAFQGRQRFKVCLCVPSVMKSLSGLAAGSCSDKRRH